MPISDKTRKKLGLRKSYHGAREAIARLKRMRKPKPKQDLQNLASGITSTLGSQVFMDNELAALWDAVNERLWGSRPSVWRPAFYAGLIMATGMRRTESTLVRLEDIVAVPGQPVTFTLQPGATKRGRGRTIGVYPGFEPEFVKRVTWLRRRGHTWLFSSDLSTTGSAYPVTPDGVNRWWHKICWTAKVPYRPIHSMRHTFAVYMLRIPFKDPATGLLVSGMPIHHLRAQLGHKRTSTTLDIYADPPPELIFPRPQEFEWPGHVPNPHYTPLDQEEDDDDEAEGSHCNQFTRRISAIGRGVA